MWRSLAVAFFAFPFAGLTFCVAWLAADLRTGLLAGAAGFTVFFVAAAVNLFFVRNWSYADAFLPPAFAALWSLALAPFTFSASLFSAPAFIGAGALLGACLAATKRWKAGLRWLVLPAAVFFYEMLPLNVPGPVDDALALAGSAGVILVQLARLALPELLAALRCAAARVKAGK